MNWGFLVLCCTLALEFGVAAMQHGDDKGNGRKVNAGYTLADCVFTIIVTLWAMHWHV